MISLNRTSLPFILAASFLYIFGGYAHFSYAQLRNLSIQKYNIEWINPFSMSVKLSLSVTNDTAAYCLRGIDGVIRSDAKTITHFRISDILINEGQNVISASISLYKLKGLHLYKLIQLALDDDKDEFIFDLNMIVAWQSGKIESKSLKDINKKNVRITDS